MKDKNTVIKLASQKQSFTTPSDKRKEKILEFIARGDNRRHERLTR